MSFIPLQYTQFVGPYSRTPEAHVLMLHNIAEEAMRLWRKGSSQESLLDQLSYGGHEEVPNTHPWWTDEISYITHVPPEEKMVVTHDTGSGLKLARPEHKRFVRMKDVLQKFLKLKHLVVDPIVVTFATAKECMLIWWHRPFLESKVDIFCYSETLNGFVGLFVRELLSEDMAIIGDEEMQESGSGQPQLGKQ